MLDPCAAQMDSGLVFISSAQMRAAAPETSGFGWLSRRWKPSEPSSRATHGRVGLLSHSTNKAFPCATNTAQTRSLVSDPWEPARNALSDPAPFMESESACQHPRWRTYAIPERLPLSTFSLSKKVKWPWMFLQLQYFFSVIAYTVQSIPIGNLEMILFFLFQGGSGTQLLKASQTALHAPANWWEACLHEYASRLSHWLKRSPQKQWRQQEWKKCFGDRSVLFKLSLKWMPNTPPPLWSSPHCDLTWLQKLLLEVPVIPEQVGGYGSSSIIHLQGDWGCFEYRSHHTKTNPSITFYWWIIIMF